MEQKDYLKEYGRLFLLLIIGTLFAKTLYNSYHNDNIFAIIVYLILGFFLSFIFYLTYQQNKLEYLETKNMIISFIPTFIGIMILSINVGIFISYEIKENRPTLIKAESHGVYADFKKSGEYIIKSGSWASRTHYYGGYSIKDSVITIDKKGFDNVLVSDRFVIRKIENKSMSFGRILVEIDQNGNDIKNRLVDFDKNHNEIFDSYKFEIIEDNRN